MRFDIDPRKITDYLLTHRPDAAEEAKGKSRFFHGIGYSLGDWATLRDDLLRHPTMSMLERTVEQPRRKVVFRCSMPAAPNGSAYCVRTVWTMRDGGDETYWLSTAYPQKDAHPSDRILQPRQR